MFTKTIRVTNLGRLIQTPRIQMDLNLTSMDLATKFGLMALSSKATFPKENLKAGYGSFSKMVQTSQITRASFTTLIEK